MPTTDGRFHEPIESQVPTSAWKREFELESRALVLLPFEGILHTANHRLALNDGHKPDGDGES